ncbi:MAG: hypothetical protein SFU55_02395 [Methylophilus sp.]|nr:hypothetical protein [Methylophilus sp.]
MSLFCKKVFTFISTVIVTASFSSLLTPAFGRESIYERVKKNAFVSHITISAPLGYFLLIRKDSVTCAFRFTDYQASDNGSSGAGVHVSKATAEYDYFYQDDGSSDFKKENVVSGHSKLSSIVTSFDNAVPNRLIKCGSFEFKWAGVGIFMSNQIPVREEGVEFAPTKWRDISEVNFNDSRVTWYRIDFKRDELEIPAEDLW